MESEGSRHRENLLAVHRVRLPQQVRQVEQVQGGEAHHEAPHGQAKADKARDCSYKWGEEGGDRAGQAGGGSDGQVEGPHHIQDHLALWQV